MRSLPLFLAVSTLVLHAGPVTTAEAYRKIEPTKRSLSTLTAFIGVPGQVTEKKTARNTSIFARRPHKLNLRAAGQFRIKPKTNKSVSKRFKITATGKIMYKRAGRSHLQRNKTHGAKRRLKRSVQLKNPRMIRKILSVLHNR